MGELERLRNRLSEAIAARDAASADAEAARDRAEVLTEILGAVNTPRRTGPLARAPRPPAPGKKDSS